MGLISKLINANRHAKTRLHDEKGNFVGWSKFLMHGPQAVSSGFLRIMFAHRPRMPWIAYDAIHYFDSFLNQKSRVLEFGSGMSTLWYAERAGMVVSVEDYRPWYEKVLKDLGDRSSNNVDYRFAQDHQEYTGFMSSDKEKFDLIVVDGSHRESCAETATHLVKPGGIIYLDNSDRSAVSGCLEMITAENILRYFAKRVGAEIISITDFAPAQLFVNQGLLIKVPGNYSSDAIEMIHPLNARTPDFTAS